MKIGNIIVYSGLFALVLSSATFFWISSNFFVSSIFHSFYWYNKLSFWNVPMCILPEVWIEQMIVFFYDRSLLRFHSILRVSTTQYIFKWIYIRWFIFGTQRTTRRQRVVDEWVLCALTNDPMADSEFRWTKMWAIWRLWAVPIYFLSFSSSE